MPGFLYKQVIVWPVCFLSRLTSALLRDGNALAGLGSDDYVIKKPMGERFCARLQWAGDGIMESSVTRKLQSFAE
jgi:hypothetical protein